MLLHLPKTSFPLASLGVLLVFGILATLYSLVTPLWEAPDEVGHFQYIAHLSAGRGLPIQRIGEFGEAHQPPLYYIIAALAAMPADLDDFTGSFTPNPRFIWARQGGDEVNIGVHTTAETFPFQGQALGLRLARGMSVLLAFLTVAVTLAIGREIFPERPLIAVFGASLVALTPQFLFISGAINNDNLLTLAATGAWWQIVRAIKRPEQWRQWAYVGVWAGVGILAKVSGPVILGVAGCALLACALQRRSPRLFVKGASAIAFVVLLMTGWWFVRNQVLYGDPLGWTMYQMVFPSDLRETPLQWHEVAGFFSVQFRSFWAVFGWMNVAPHPWFYIPYSLLWPLALLGLALLAARRRFGNLSGSQAAAVALLFATIMVQETFLASLATFCDASCYQGRYLFPVIGPLMILTSLGIISLVPRRLTVPVVGCIVVVLFGATALAPMWVIRPAYQVATSL